jgi:hypothetical protein
MMLKQRGHCGVSSVVERYPSKLDVVGSSPILRFPTMGITMSLISQKDRDLAIEALDFYLFNKKFDFTETKRGEINALLNWIKLEKYKHEN